jgi:hypothetical protein
MYLRNSSARVGVVVQVVERHFGFDHPELGEVTRGVAVFGAEGRSEGVDLAEGERENLSFQLPANGQIRGLAEKV